MQYLKWLKRIGSENSKPSKTIRNFVRFLSCIREFINNATQICLPLI